MTRVDTYPYSEETVRTIHRLYNDGVNSLDIIRELDESVAPEVVTKIGQLTTSELNLVVEKSELMKKVGDLLFNSDMTFRSISKRLGVHEAMISRIKHGKSYPWVRAYYLRDQESKAPEKTPDVDVPQYIVRAAEKLFEDYTLTDNDIAQMLSISSEVVDYLRKKFIYSDPIPEDMKIGTDITSRTLAWICYNLIYTKFSQYEIGIKVGLNQDKVSRIQTGVADTSRLVEMGFLKKGETYTEMAKARNPRLIG